MTELTLTGFNAEYKIRHSGLNKFFNPIIEQWLKINRERSLKQVNMKIVHIGIMNV
jgi:hypothetical protein